MTLELAHGCVSCTLREDLLPLLRRLAGMPEVARIVLRLDESSWLADAMGDDTLAERGRQASPEDERR
ncbi:G3E family GTPase [Amycolatopsis bartoniae]|uniref:CobW/HypB/UreG nucleotide-binding domain-containing protein n=1 Tax=Amycolatopsis bartoniae TaxID=941986 RepID=A0A8H9ITW9_9PSEU|nr:G3E family GTPase [Amycolatopsis bartoniae]TVT07270.1 hypothetical protein FNH07_17180 [Amycolatopsis bartoniae]GHF51047.1 hypothetical protein GCM10017566_25210 [Amycolatopsis bartoniae]